jgi:hypothetical protein
VPQNRRARLGAVTLTSSRTLDLDVPVAQVTPAVRLDGAAPPPTGAELRLTRGADEVPLGPIAALEAAVRVVPGTYDVVYVLDDPRDEPSGIPRNRRSVVRRGVEIGGAMRLEVELASAPVSGRAGEGRVVLGGVALGDAPTALLAGEYDVEHWLSSLVHAVVDRVHVAGPTTVEVGGRAVTLAARVTVNGAPAPLDDGGAILLRRGARSIWLGHSTARSFGARLIAGQGPYDVVWSYPKSAPGLATVPQNQEAVLARGVDVDALAELVVDVPAVPLSGRVVGLAAGEAVVLAAVAEPANRLTVVPHADGSFATLALPGAYRVLHRPGPPNAGAAPWGAIVSVAAPATVVELVVPAREVAGAVTFGGAATADARGFTLSFVAEGEAVGLFGGAPLGVRRLVPGRDQLVYPAGAAPGELPANERAVVGCVVVAP